MRQIISLIIVLLTGSLFSNCSKTDEGLAIIHAKKIVKEFLVSPTTAKFSNEKVIERTSQNLYLIQLTVDSQNMYSAIVREYFLVVVELTDKDTFGTYYYNPKVGAQRFYNLPGEDEINITKSINEWHNWQYH